MSDVKAAAISLAVIFGTITLAMCAEVILQSLGL